MSAEEAADPRRAEAGGDFADLTITGIFETAAAADQAASNLIAAGIPPDEISLAMKHPDGEWAELPPQIGAEGSPEDRGAMTGISVGAVAGGLAGLLALAVPGIGPLIAAGPLAMVLGGATAGGIAGGLIGSLTGLGVTEEHARHYESDVQAGNVLLAVRAPAGSAAGLRQILTDSGAHRVDQYPAPARPV